MKLLALTVIAAMGSWTLAPQTSSQRAYVQLVDHVTSSLIRVTGVPATAEQEPLQVDHAWKTTEWREHQVMWVCSGFVWRNGLVLTAGHCVKGLIKADGLNAEILRVDHVMDLALLRVPTAQKPSLPVAERQVDRFEDLTGIGYAWGLTRPSVLAERLFLVHVAPDEGMVPGLLVQGGYIGGMSGGPVVDARGEVVGLVQRSNGSIGYGVGALTIRAFLVGAP